MLPPEVIARAQAERFLSAGASAVFYSGPPATPEEQKQIPLLLHGVTLDAMTAETRVASMGSCTTNSVVAPILALHDAFGVEVPLLTIFQHRTLSALADSTVQELSRTDEEELRQMLDELDQGGVYMKMDHPPSRRG